MKKLIFFQIFPVLISSLFLHLYAVQPEERTITSADITFAPELGSLRKLSVHSNDLYQLADINKDGQTDIITYTSGKVNYISLRTFENMSIGEIPLSEPLKGSFFSVDINNDSIPEVFYLSVHKGEVLLNIYNPATFKKKQIKVFKGKNYFADKIYDVNLSDVKILKHSGGERLLLVEVSTGHDLQPRGVLAFSLPGFKAVWKFLMGSYLQMPMLVRDINGDGKQEILISTTAYQNGDSLNGYSDENSFLIALDENGRDIAKYKFAGPLSYCFFNVLLPENDIIVYGYSKNVKSKQPDIILLDPGDFHKKASFSIKKRRFLSEGAMNRTIPRMNFANFFYDRHNILHFLDARLKETKAIRFVQPISNIHTLYRQKDGSPLVLVVLQNMAEKSATLVLFNKDMRIIGKKQCNSENPSLFQLCEIEKGQSIYFVDGMTKEIYEWFIPSLSINRSFNLYYFIQKHQTLLIAIGLFIVILFIISIILNLIAKKNLHIQKYKSLSDYFMENPSEAILLINENGLVSGYNQSFKNVFSDYHPENYLQEAALKFFDKIGQKQILQHVQNALDEDAQLFHRIFEFDILLKGKNSKFKAELQKVVLGEKHFTLVLKLFDLTSLMRADRISNWAAIAQKLAHEIKNPLMSMTLSLGRLEKKLAGQEGASDLDNNKYLDFIREDIARMRDSANQFMRFTSSLNFNFSDFQLNNMIKELVHDYEFIAAERIEFDMELADDLPLVHIDVEQTKQILKYIIDNGIDAVKGPGIIHIKTTLIERIPEKSGLEEKYVQLTIADSGTGIAKENLAKLFEPGFTTKETGAGFGLAIAKHVVEEQGGAIAISGRKDVGTIVTIEFPVNPASPLASMENER